MEQVKQVLRFPRIAFFGFARAGKDEAAKPLISAGYERRCFGDIIKRQLRSSMELMKVDSFTETDSEKSKIRPLLELWGDVFYEEVIKEFFDTLPGVCVNTRICRLREMVGWENAGGIIIHLTRLGVSAATKWEMELLEDFLLFRDKIAKPGTVLHLSNSDGIGELHHRIRSFAGIGGGEERA